MSAGPFVVTRYEDDNGTNIRRIRIQQETGDVNIAPTGDVNSYPSATVSGTRSRRGAYGRVLARGIALANPAAPPAGYTGGPVYIPILTPEQFALFEEGVSTVSYLGTTWTVIAKVPERKA